MSVTQQPVRAEELMIGSVLSYRGEKICYVSSIGSNGFETCYFHNDMPNGSNDISDYDGIPLTPEILKKCGFRQEIHRSISSATAWFYTDDLDLKQAGGFANPMYWTLGTAKTPKIYHLHQLQNLYHALTGSHLKVDEI